MSNSKEIIKKSIPLTTRLTRGFGPGCLAGIRFGDWCKLMAANSFHVDFPYWGKACHITISSLCTSPFAWAENLVYGSSIKKTKVETPIFILGSWRSGTTHLHNLMCQDERYAAPDLFQTMYPSSYRLARWWWEPILSAVTPRKRFMDNVKMSLREPAEDEMALGILARASNSLSWVFPDNAARYDEHLSFENADEKDRDRFKQSLQFFVAKVQQTFNRPLILKSPNHTARIKLILELFPDAKFLHIRRHPYDVFRSFQHMASQVIPVWGLQEFEMNHLEEMVIETYRKLYQAYFDQKSLIPAGQFHEVAYEELTVNPIQELEQTYQTLQLPSFELARPKVEAYLEKTGDYRKNKHVEIPASTRKRIREEWQFCFDAWGYEQDLSELN
ncbi:sulfotransferase family protein [Rubinisphaera italica]|uniref:Sulfotransferase domain protein n=1 Tax=Rubinisphaera italica TaxID=2527969 RepID=A0A5C5XMU4_9PLAN|nr:sulfotransferase [Rubinisphaera italica]TWT64516.1 Sulfotransferase domain protein [Rubinisphaera italica]